MHDILSSSHINPESQVFVSNKTDTQLYPFSNFIRQPNWGSHTKIDEAFSFTSDRQVIVLVTDNIQDSGDEDYSSIRNFYNMLEGDEIHSVLLLPVKFPFSGRLYFDRNQYPDSSKLLERLRSNNSSDFNFSEDNYNSAIYTAASMNGEKSLAIYFIFFQELLPRQKKNLINTINNYLEIEPLVIKPVDQGRFFLKGINDKKTIENSFDKHHDLCSTEDSKQFKPLKPNLRFVPPQSNIVKQTDFYQLLSFRKNRTKHYIDQTNTYRFYFTIVNKTNTVVLGTKDCSRELKIELRDIEYNFHPSYKKIFKNNTDAGSRLIPPFIPGLIAPDSELSREGSPVFFTEIRIPRFKMELSLASFFRLAFVNSIPLRINGNINVTVPQGYFSLEEEYKNRYFTGTAMDQSKIYTPEDIVHYIRTKPISLQFIFSSQNLKLMPPAWIKIVAYSLGLAMLLLLGYIFYSIQLRYSLKFDDTGEKILFYLPIPFTKKEYMRNNQIIFYVKKDFFSYSISPANNHDLLIDSKAVHSLKLKKGISFKISGEQGEKILVTVLI